MLTISLLRHMKSSWAEGERDDHDRPLNKRGLRSAPVMAAVMTDNLIVPDLILCSSARRTRETLALIEPELQSQPDIAIERDLYLAESEDLLARLQAVPDRYRHAMIIGHNPGLQDLACGLVATAAPVILKAVREKFPTGALAVLNSDAEHWRDLTLKSCSLAQYHTPAENR